MIQDFRSSGCPDDLAADVCIIGAGPAGIWLASALAGSQWTVCVLESGGSRAEAASQALNQGESVGPHGLDPALCRLRALGGASWLWGGGCIPLSSEEMAARDWVPGSGWPIGWDELAPWYSRAALAMGIDPPDVADGGFLPDPATVGDGAPSRPLDWRTSRTRILDFGRAYRDRLAGARGLTVVLHANLLRLQASADARAVRQAVIGNLDGRTGRVRARCFVLAAGGIENARLLLLSDDVVPGGLGNGHGLVGRCFMDHPRCRIGTLRHCDTARLARLYARPRDDCASPAYRQPGLATQVQRERRLLHSRVRPFVVEQDPPAGLAALRGLGAALRSRSAGDESAQVEARVLDALDRDLPQRQAIATGRPGRLALRTLLHADDVVRATLKRLAHQPAVDTDRVELTGYFEQAPDRDSRVGLSDRRDALGQRRVRVDWRMSALDEQSIRISSRLIGQALAAEFGGRFAAEDWLDDPDAPLPLHGTAHHMGTTRVSAVPANGVVDPHCRVHGMDNLYVAGSSVFPAGGWSFPTFTVVALSLRLGEELRRRLPGMPMPQAHAQAAT